MSRSVWTNKSSMFLMSFEKKPIAIDPRLVRNFADVKPTLAHVASRPKQRVTTSPCSAARLAMAGLMRAAHCAVSPRGGTPGLVGDETGASIGGRADGIGHDRTARAERLCRSDRRIARSLVLDLGIQLGANQHHGDGKPHPHHQANHRAERAIGGIVIREIG